MLVGGDQMMAGRQLINTVIQSAQLVPAKAHCMIDTLLIPACGHARCKKRLDFGSEVKRVLMPGVEERLDAEPVTRSKETAPLVVPNDQGKLATQFMHTLRPELFPQMKRNLTVGARAKAMAA